MTQLFYFLIGLIFLNSSFAQFQNESELGIVAANGNTKAQTYNLKQFNDYQWETNTLKFNARYLHAKAEGVEIGRYFTTGLRYERHVTNPLSLYAGELMEKDKFAGIDTRLVSDVGGKYQLQSEELTKLFFEVGYRYMDELRINDSSVYSHYGRVYVEWDQTWNKNFSTKLHGEYLPNLSRNKDWQLNSELSLWAMMSDLFSLKTAILIRYDHDPAPGILYKTDSLFTTSIVARF
jgi:putative salt-induced outer membrane protein YdiY